MVPSTFSMESDQGLKIITNIEIEKSFSDFPTIGENLCGKEAGR